MSVHQRLVWALLANISVHQRLVWALLANISVHQRLEKQPYARSCPLYPPALSPPAKALGAKGGQAGLGLGLEGNSQAALRA